MTTIDPFEDILNLEEEFYSTGYNQGLSDGIASGRIEGRTFGLEKGFEKYVEMGRLHGKSIVWANRIPSLQKPKIPTVSNSEVKRESQEKEGSGESSHDSKLPELSKNERLAKHVNAFYALAEADSLSTENSEEAVGDFDDRFQRAVAKAKIIEKMVGENGGKVGGKSSGDGAIEDRLVLGLLKTDCNHLPCTLTPSKQFQVNLFGEKAEDSLRTHGVSEIYSPKATKVKAFSSEELRPSSREHKGKHESLWPEIPLKLRWLVMEEGEV
ncbi:hypothetical protein DSL72_001293 [Monilinia vaccinii-corymbosi]|uniref:Essential protein Yae1 N-terminal domain-containing protein n=1 Tax=Monilinia vaccinii-corymbosi TaxID=61207 RepID=A0A8A3P767_9HELO|nr:hypothetical protein DSL72_001293 [Monilinia vaccinii-corymbosi]